MKSLSYLVGGMVLSALLARSALAEPAKLKPLSEADVLKLVELSIEEDAVVHRLKAGGVNFNVDGEVIAHLRKAGASEKILAALKGDVSPAVAPAEKVIASGKKDGPDDKPAERAAGDVIASGQHKSGAVLELTEIKRTSDGFLRLNFRYRNPTDAPLKSHHGLAVFGDTDVTGEVFSEIYYVEPNQKLKHRVVSDNGGKLLASMVVASDLLAPAKGTGGTFWVKTSSPSTGVDKVTFYFPGVTPMEDVPLPPAKK